MNAHQIDANNVIINTIVVDSLDIFPNLVDAEFGGSIGDRIIDGVVLPKTAPPPTVPSEITRRQGLQQLRIEGFTESDIEAKIAALPISDLQKDLALIEFKTSQTFERSRPLVATLGAMIGKDSAGLDGMFINAKALP